MFCALKVHLYDKQAIVFAFGIFWVSLTLFIYDLIVSTSSHGANACFYAQ